jgi:hypothetical protein
MPFPGVPIRDVTESYAALKSTTITKSDSTVLPLTAAVYVGVAGDLAVQYRDGTQDIIRNAYAGYHPLQVVKVLSTGTTAASMNAIY